MGVFTATGDSLPTLFGPKEAGSSQASRHWYRVRQSDTAARALFERHYTCTGRGNYAKSHSIVGPGERIVLLTGEGDALFVWRKEKHRADDQRGANCAVFRNESPILSSTLVQEACQVAWQRWPGERLFTFVNPRRIRSTNPGYCFLQAGWLRCGTTPKGLAILGLLWKGGSV